jgi:acid phosphatase type 7
VTRTTSSKATVNWHGETDGLGSVEYAMSSYYDTHQKFQNTVTCQTKSGYQHVELVDLRPNTVYVYRVKPSGKNDAYDIRSFRTMPVKGKFVFIVISDTQEGHDYTEAMRFKLVADAIAKETEAVFVLHGGDNAGHDSPALWLKYFEAADAMLARTAIYPTIGNHEYHNDGGVHPPATAEQYRWSYDVPEHYSFECAGIRFIVLDTPDPATAETDDPHTSPALAQSQVEWLKKELDNHMSGTFTIHHHPIWDQDRITTNSDLQPWEDLYHAFGISATFAGHTHDYQRYSIGGIPYFVVGNAGGRFADITDDTQFAAGYVIAKTRNLGYLRVTVDPANNTATADEIFVASVQEDDSDETPVVFDPPHIADTVTFPLSVAPGKVQHPAAFQVQLVNQP